MFASPAPLAPPQTSTIPHPLSHTTYSSLISAVQQHSIVQFAIERMAIIPFICLLVDLAALCFLSSLPLSIFVHLLSPLFDCPLIPSLSFIANIALTNIRFIGKTTSNVRLRSAGWTPSYSSFTHSFASHSFVRFDSASFQCCSLPLTPSLSIVLSRSLPLSLSLSHSLSLLAGAECCLVSLVPESHC